MLEMIIGLIPGVIIGFAISFWISCFLEDREENNKREKELLEIKLRNMVLEELEELKKLTK